MTSTYKVYVKENNKSHRHLIKDDACFGRFSCRYGGSTFNYGQYRHAPANIHTIRYYPERRGISAEECVTCFEELQAAMPELPWPKKGNFLDWEKKGMAAFTDIPGQVSIGLFTLVRYVNEYPGTLQQYLLMRKVLGVTPLQALHLAHNLSSVDGGIKWDNVVGHAGHSIIPSHTLHDKVYKHFVGKKWALEMQKLKPYKEYNDYQGIHKLFAGDDNPYRKEQWFPRDMYGITGEQIMNRINKLENIG